MPNISQTPLADRMRPTTLEEFLGQEEIVGSGKLLRQAIESDHVPSMIFWGPPGSGKTTLAVIIAKKTRADFISLSAVASGLKELRAVISRAESNQRLGQKTILFIDEIHRWNKTQQDALLPVVERGVITLIGATTENPSFEVQSALLSRCRVFVLKSLTQENILVILHRAISDREKGLGTLNLSVSEKTLHTLATMSNGDARTSLNVLEYAASIMPKITPETLQEAFQKSHLMYDKSGEEHYNIISALHKSMRGSDVNASVYWMMRMLEGGEDPLYIARRVIRFASEDIGLANPEALVQAVAAYQACHFIGMPECSVNLAQAVTFCAQSPKSNALYVATEQAKKDIREKGNLPVPLHIRNAPTRLMKDLGYSKGYQYSPDFDYQEKQTYLPDELQDRKYFKTDQSIS